MIDNATEPPPTAGIEPHGRRNFFRWLTAALTAIAGVLLAVPLVGYFLARRPRKIEWIAVGRVEDFPINETRMVTFDNPLRQSWDGITAHTGVYVRRAGPERGDNGQFLVLAVNCAHLGCPVSWFPQSGLFMCPCHGGVYYASGERASGPPTRGLFRCVWQVRSGQLEIQAPHYPTLQDTLADTG
jgi:menaquinol-cytochrome c reductase iron-sulfur subunit